MYQILSPDGFWINYGTPYYPSLKKAYQAFKEWKKLFEWQGYYSQACYNRQIPLDQLKDYCKFIKI